MLVSCPSCGKRISDRAPACPFCKAAPTAAPPVESTPAAVPALTVPAPSPLPEVAAPAPLPPPVETPSAPPPIPQVPFPPSDDPTATLPPSALPPEFLATLARPAPAPAPAPATAPPVPPEPPLPEAPLPSPQPDAASTAVTAAESLSAGRVEETLATVDRLLLTEPRNGEALNTRAQALFKLGQREEAARVIVKALEASPDALTFWLNKAVMEHEEGKKKQACRSAMDLVEIAQHAEADSPVVDQAREMIAAFEQTGAFPTARGYLGWLGLGCASMKAGRAEAALGFFDRTIDAASGNAGGFRWKGRALTQLEQLDEALALFDTALEIAPNDPDIHHDRGIVFAMMGDAARAIEAFDAALAVDPHHAASLMERRKYTA